MSSSTVTVTVVDHPVVADALARIRDATTPNALFRQNLERIGSLLLVRATEDLPTVDTTVTTPLTDAPARRLAVQPVVVPILRAGLGFVHAAQELLPDADVGFVGISRDEETFAPKPYVNKLPESLAGRPVIVVDPMLATGGSLVHTIELLLERGAPEPIIAVCALCAPEGIERLREAGLTVHVVTAAVDDHLNDQAFIVPGLGDAGDRQFGPPPDPPPELGGLGLIGRLPDANVITATKHQWNSGEADEAPALVVDLGDLGADCGQVARR